MLRLEAQVSYEEVDRMFAELLKLEAEVKEKSKSISLIKDWCKEQGSFTTGKYVCSIKQHSRTGLVGLQKAIDCVGRELLEETGMIQTSQYETVHISKIGGG